MIFQQFNLLMQRTTGENICSLELAGVKDAARERAHNCLSWSTYRRAQSYPSQLGRAKTARRHRPKILLCDEALPPSTPPLRSILSLIRTSTGAWGSPPSSSRTKGVIEKICNQVAIISHGRIAETGSVEGFSSTLRPKKRASSSFPRRRLYRIIFNGRSRSSRSSIWCWNAGLQSASCLRDIGGTAFGQMVATSDNEVVRRILAYLKGLEEMKNV
ncbi:MAG: hypothetical protein ACLSAH_07110 [Bilophila wadsworthia]